MALVTAKELAIELNLTPKYVRRLALIGQIPAERYGKEWRFDLEAVRKAANYVDPIRADAQQAARRLWLAPRRRHT